MAKKGAAKGGKNRRRAKGVGGARRELIIKENEQEYALVTKMLGNGRLLATSFDDNSTERMCHIRGAMRKKVWVNIGDIILISLRDFQDEKADVIFRYTPEETRQLKKLNQIPSSVKVTAEQEKDSEDDNPYVYDEGDSEEIDIENL